MARSINAGAVVVVKETGELGVVEAVHPSDELSMWSVDVVFVRTSRRGDAKFFFRPELTQLYTRRS
jgi:hypothetical protein